MVGAACYATIVALCALGITSKQAQSREGNVCEDVTDPSLKSVRLFSHLIHHTEHIAAVLHADG